jgi:plasmid replication initiation protein
MDAAEQEFKIKIEVIKHSAAIQIQNNITLLQRRLWNGLLYNAYNELPTEEEHHITLQELANLIGYDSHDMEYLKGASLAMMHCILQWNILNKDGSTEWGATALLAQIKIHRGTCTYAYSPELRRRLHNPSMYARLDLNLQKQFESKYALALWELCSDYLGSGRQHGETPLISVEQFRTLIGLRDGSYPQFMNFNQKVLKPAVAEINRVSDFRVTVDYLRQGRRVTALKFKIHRVLMLPHGQQPDLFPDLADMPIAVKALTDAGLPLKDAMAVWQKGFDGVEPNERPAEIGDNPEHAFTRYVREKIHLLEQRKKGGKVENPGGFLLTAIKKNYTNAKFAEKEAHNERQSKMKELRTLQNQKEKIERERDDVLQRACDKVIEAFPEMAERAVDALQDQHNAAFRHCYDQTKSAVENYKSHRFIAETIGQWLESQLPEDFEKKREPFRSKLEAIDARIKALESEGVKAARA